MKSSDFPGVFNLLLIPKERPQRLLFPEVILKERPELAPYCQARRATHSIFSRSGRN